MHSPAIIVTIVLACAFFLRHKLLNQSFPFAYTQKHSATIEAANAKAREKERKPLFKIYPELLVSTSTHVVPRPYYIGQLHMYMIIMTLWPS